MSILFIPGNRNLSNSCVPTNNKKIINSSNNFNSINLSKVNRQVNILKYSLGGNTSFGNRNPALEPGFSDKFLTVDLSTNFSPCSSINQPISEINSTNILNNKIFNCTGTIPQYSGNTNSLKPLKNKF
jgi:hypothetical protein